METKMKTHTPSRGKAFKITYKPHRHEGVEVFNLVEHTYDVVISGTFTREDEVVGFNATSLLDDSFKRFHFSEINSMVELEVAA